jgi:hypothetical protein
MTSRWFCLGMLSTALFARGAEQDLTRAEIATLVERKLEFEEASREEKSRLRTLHEAVNEASAEGRSLRRSFEGYERWLATLPEDDRRRLTGAKTTEERLAIVRETLAKQTSEMSIALAPLEAAEAADSPLPDAGRRPPGSDRARMTEEIRSFAQKIDDRITPLERQALQSGQGRNRLPLIGALSLKYAVELPEGFRGRPPPSYFLFSSLVDDFSSTFGSRSFLTLSPEQKQRFGAFAADILLLPELDETKRFEFLRSQPAAIQRGIEKVAAVNGSSAKIVVSALYYSQHPDEAPEPLQASVRMIHRKSLTALLERGIGRGRSPRPPKPGPPPHAGGSSP